MIMPEGTRVKKGELVCELDSASLEDQLDQPADHDQERRGQLRERQADPRGRRDRRRSSTSRASSSRTSRPSRARSSWPSPTCRAPRTALDWARRMFEKGYVSMAPEGLGRADPQEGPVRARAGAEQEEGAGRLHQGQDDQGAQERGREGPLRRAGQEGDLGAGEEQGREAREADRRLRASRPRPTAWSSTPTIPTGRSAATSRRSRKAATVRERQKIFSLPDISQMQVNTKVHESQIDKHRAEHEGQDPGRRLRRPDARRHGGRTSRPCPTRPTSSARTSRSTRPRSRSTDPLPGSGRA